MRDYKFQLNLVTNNKVDSKRFKQLDTGNEIELEVYQNENLQGDEKVVLTNETILAFFKRKDGTVLQKSCSIKDGNIVVQTAKDILEVPGELQLECMIKNGDIETTTQRMNFMVDERIVREGAIESDPRYYADLVTDLLDVRDNVKAETVGKIEEVDVKVQDVDIKYEERTQEIELLKANFSLLQRCEPKDFELVVETDYQGALNRCAEYAVANGLVMYIPTKSTPYIIGDKVEMPSKLTLLSNGAEVKVKDGANCRYAFVNKDRINGNHDIFVSNLKVDCNQGNQDKAMIRGNMLGITFESASDTSCAYNNTVAYCTIINSSIALRAWVGDEKSSHMRPHSNKFLFNILDNCINKIIEINYADKTLVEGNICTNCFDGIQTIFNSQDNKIVNNFVGCSSSGLNISHGAKNNIFENNTVYGNSNLLFIRADAENSFASTTGNKVINNTFKMLGRGNIFTFGKLGSALGDMEFLNNTIKGNKFIGKSTTDLAYVRLYNVSTNDVNCTIDNLFLEDNEFENCVIVAGDTERNNCLVKKIYLKNNKYKNSYIVPGEIDKIIIDDEKVFLDTFGALVRFNTTSKPKKIYFKNLELEECSLISKAPSLTYKQVLIKMSKCNVESVNTGSVAELHNVEKLYIDDCDFYFPNSNSVVYYSNTDYLSASHNRLTGRDKGFNQAVGSTGKGKCIYNEFFGIATQYYNMPDSDYTKIG